MNQFQPDKFAELTKTAMGANRNISMFAKTLQINRKYLEKILNGTPQTPPNMSIVKRIIREAEGRVKSDELYAAAGYLQSKELPEIITEEPKPSKKTNAASAKKAITDYTLKIEKAKSIEQTLSDSDQKGKTLIDLYHRDNHICSIDEDISIDPKKVNIPDELLKKPEKKNCDLNDEPVKKKKPEKPGKSSQKSDSSNYSADEEARENDSEEVTVEELYNAAELAIYRFIREEYSQKKKMEITIRPGKTKSDLCFGIGTKNIHFNIYCEENSDKNTPRR